MRGSNSSNRSSDSEPEKPAAVSRASANTLKRLPKEIIRGKMKQDDLSEPDSERPTSQKRKRYMTVKLAHNTVPTYLDQKGWA
jgi:hypothetical protein